MTNDELRALADAIRERDDHARWRADLADKLHDRETTISAAWEALRSAGVHSEATIDDGIRLLRRQLAEAELKREPLPGLAPTHRCPACGALWRQCDDASWNLRSALCCGLCDAGRVELVRLLDEPKREPLSEERIAEIQRAAYERAVMECIETAAELRRCGDGCTDGRYDWKADGALDCADAIRALGGNDGN